MYCVIEFDNGKKECSVVPLLWLTEDEKVCLWPQHITKQDVFEEYVTSKRTPAVSGWKKHKIRKIHQICGKYKIFMQFFNVSVSTKDNNSTKKCSRLE